jgi:rubredoxin-NAD+ reductase
VMPVTVKTPATPAVVVSPDAQGEWLIDLAAHAGRNAARAVCRHADSGRPIGFALVGAAIEGKAALLKEMASGTG